MSKKNKKKVVEVCWWKVITIGSGIVIGTIGTFFLMKTFG